MKVKYVEAMIANPEPWTMDVEPTHDHIPTIQARDAIDKAAAAFDSGETQAIASALLSLSVATEELLDEIGNHECVPSEVEVSSSDEETVPLIPVSHPLPLRRQFDTMFLRSDVMAILRLSDLEALIAMAGAEHFDRHLCYATFRDAKEGASREVPALR